MLFYFILFLIICIIQYFFFFYYYLLLFIIYVIYLFILFIYLLFIYLFIYLFYLLFIYLFIYLLFLFIHSFTRSLYIYPNYKFNYVHTSSLPLHLSIHFLPFFLSFFLSFYSYPHLLLESDSLHLFSSSLLGASLLFISSLHLFLELSNDVKFGFKLILNIWVMIVFISPLSFFLFLPPFIPSFLSLFLFFLTLLGGCYHLWLAILQRPLFICNTIIILWTI